MTICRSVLLRHAEKTEGAAEMKGDWNGMPFMIIVAVRPQRCVASDTEQGGVE
jgi:hypothetical protein